MLGRWPIEIIPDNPPAIAFAQAAEGNAACRPADRLPGQRRLRRRDRQGGDPARRRKCAPATRRSSSNLPLPGLHLKEAAGHQLPRFVAASLGRPAGRDPARRDRRAGPDRRERAGPDDVAGARTSSTRSRARSSTSARSWRRDPAFADGGRRNPRRPERAAAALSATIPSLSLGAAPRAAAAARRQRARTRSPRSQQLLWDTALRIEDGKHVARRARPAAPAAAAAGRARQERARRRDRAADEGIAARRSTAICRRWPRNARNPDQSKQPVDPSKVITSRDLQRMLDRARDLARSGARDQARELLSQLQNMLENLRTARPGQMQQQGASEAQQMMRGMQRADAASAAAARPQLPRSVQAAGSRASRQHGQPGRQQRGQQPGRARRGGDPAGPQRPDGRCRRPAGRRCAACSAR